MEEKWHLFETNLSCDIEEVKEMIDTWEVLQYDEDSGMGCAMNVLAFLDIVTKEAALEEIKLICEAMHPPKNNGTQSSEIVTYLHDHSGFHLSYDTISFFHDNTSMFNINQALSAFFYLKDNMNRCATIIIKLHYANNLHHTLLLFRTEEELYTIDVQLDRVRKVDATFHTVSESTRKWLSRFHAVSFYITNSQSYPTQVMDGIYPMVNIERIITGGNMIRTRKKSCVIKKSSIRSMKRSSSSSSVKKSKCRSLKRGNFTIEAPAMISELLYSDISVKNLDTITKSWNERRDLKRIQKKIQQIKLRPIYSA